MDAEQVKAQIADYKQRAEAAEKDRDEKLAAAAFDAKIDKALADAKAHNPKLARGALDLDALRSSKKSGRGHRGSHRSRTEKRRIPVRAGRSRDRTRARIRHRDLCCAGHGKVYCRRDRHAQGCGSARGLTVSHTLHRKAR